MSSLLASVRRLLRPSYRLHHVYERLLGTEVELQIVAQNQALAEAAEEKALAELDRLVLIFNRFDAQSELRQWLLVPNKRQAISSELYAVLEQAEEWRVKTGGAFHAGADAYGAVWQQAQAQGQIPTEQQLKDLGAILPIPPWTLFLGGTATPHVTTPLGLNALAKGFIVDKVAEIAAQSVGVSAVLVNAGGDLRTIGGTGLAVVIADPFSAKDDAKPLGQVWVQGGALATSGSSHRGYEIRGKRYSHLIDPRTGQPVESTVGVTVLAPTCAVADALATALSVLDIASGLKLVEQTPDCSALIVTEDGQHFSSAQWPK